MVEENLNSFKEVKREIELGYKMGANMLITTFPGYSVSRYLKKIAESDEFMGLTYINSDGKELQKYNLLDFDYVENFKESMHLVEQYIKQARLDQKFAVLINAPWVLKNETFETSYLGTHHYRVFRYKRPKVETVGLFAKEMDASLSEEELKGFYFLTGGVGRLGKFLLLNLELLNKSVDEILENDEIRRMVKSLLSSYMRVSDEELTEYGVKENGVFTSALVEEYFKKNANAFIKDIKIDKDLSLYEAGKRTADLTNNEANILRFIVNSDGVIKKDEVAEVKWGDKSYVDFSDEAIKKTMQRLGEKLVKYKIEAIHGYGYKMVLR